MWTSTNDVTRAVHLPPAYVKPYVKTQKNDEADAEAICEAVSRPNMRFAEVKSGNGSAQTFTIAPSTVGVSTWDASVSVRYLVRQSDGGGARAQLGFFTEPGGTP